MSKEFTTEDLRNVINLILDIKSNRDDLVKIKIGIQNQLSALKKEYSKVEFESKDFFRIKEERAELKVGLNSIEKKLGKNKDELCAKNRMKNEIEFYLKQNKVLEGGDELKRILARIESKIIKYRKFAKDRTRISSMKTMASEIADDLEDIIK